MVYVTAYCVSATAKYFGLIKIMSQYIVFNKPDDLQSFNVVLINYFPAFWGIKKFFPFASATFLLIFYYVHNST